MNIDRFDRSTPLLLSNNKIIHPYERTFTFEQNQEVDLHCPGVRNTIIINKRTDLRKSSVSLECSQNGKFVEQNVVTPIGYDLEQFSCLRPPSHVFKKVNEPMQFKVSCSGNTYASGFELSQNSFVVSEVCYDEVTEHPIITYEKMNPSHESKQYKGDAEFHFQEGPVLRHKNIDEAYKHQHTYFRHRLSPSASYNHIIRKGMFSINYFWIFRVE